MSDQRLVLVLVIIFGVLVTAATVFIRRHIRKRGYEREKNHELLIQKRTKAEDEFKKLYDAILDHHKSGSDVSADKAKLIERLSHEQRSQEIQELCADYLQDPSQETIGEIERTMRAELEKIDHEIRMNA